MKKAFTLLELIIVVGIIGIIIGSVSFFIPSKHDEQTKYAQECSQYIFQEITNEKNNIEKGKILFSGTEKLIPQESEISGFESSITINNYYKYNNDNISGSKYIIQSGYCVTNSINNKNNYIISIGTGFQTRIEKNNIYFTGNLVISYNNTTGEQISKIEYNKAINKFKLSFCLSLSGNNCSKWEE